MNAERMLRRARTRALVTDRRGVALIEFAIVAPVMCLFLVGAFDIAHTLYLQAALEGIVQKTARDSALESGTAAAAQVATDAKVDRQVRALANNATITFKRRFYRTFSQAKAAQFEPFTDTDRDGTCDNGEPYTDTNNNTVWDADGADGGQGGAKDKTIYTVTVSYPRMFPVKGFIPSMSADHVLTAKTVLQNQPYSDQGSYTVSPVSRNCP